jgi:hypothetical protein
MVGGGEKEKKKCAGDMQKCLPGRRVDVICVRVWNKFFSVPRLCQKNLMVEIVPGQYLNN